MTDHYTQPINARDLTTRLNTLKQTNGDSHNNNNNNTTMSHRRPRSSSFDSQLSRLPRFSKSSTMSTTASGSSISRLEVISAVPSSTTYRESVEVAPGEFSKPRVHKRSRRGTGGSSKSDDAGAGRRGSGRREEEAGVGGVGGAGAGGDKEFKYYGRHGNQWLFNDFSVTDAVSKGFKRVFGKEGGEGDWYENREK